MYILNYHQCLRLNFSKTFTPPMPRPSSPCKGHFVIIQIPCVAFDVLWLVRRPPGVSARHSPAGLRARGATVHCLCQCFMFYYRCLCFNFYTIVPVTAKMITRMRRRTVTCIRRDAPSLAALCRMPCLLFIVVVSISLCVVLRSSLSISCLHHWSTTVYKPTN